jgi:RHS repeat-associated protein
VYSVRPGGAAGSTATRTTGTATYSYDPQDRLINNDDGHGDVTSYTLDGPGNIHQQTTTSPSGTTTVNNTYDPNDVNHLQKSVTPSGTFLYWYDDLGRQQCVTDANGSQANCGPSENTTASTDLLSDDRYDYLDRLTTYRAFSGGNQTDLATYVYDAQNRQVQETEQHPAFNGDTHVTTFSYLGTSNLDVEEQQTSKNSGSTLSVKDFTYDVNGHRLAMTCNPCANGQGGPTTYTYGYDTHGSVSQLVDPNGNTTASYGYTPYGQSDSTLSQGDTDKTTPLNPFRYSGKRLDTGSGTLDMGVRRFGPDTSRFLTPDFFFGSLSNLGLSTDLITGNRYDLAGGNPISFSEWDGHVALDDAGSGGGPSTSPQAGRLITGDGSNSQSSQDALRDLKDKGCQNAVINFLFCRPQPNQEESQQSKVPSISVKPCPAPQLTVMGRGIGCGLSASASSQQSGDGNGVGQRLAGAKARVGNAIGAACIVWCSAIASCLVKHDDSFHCEITQWRD